MKKILTTTEAAKLAKKIRETGKKIILAGGVFDILHVGHIKFLGKARKKGDFLFVFLESDENVRQTKGENRPINTQNIRAQVLSSLQYVDYVILLPRMKNDADYDRLVTLIRPMAIAITANDKNIKHKMRQAEIIGAKVLSVVSEISNESTSRMVKIIEEENNL